MRPSFFDTLAGCALAIADRSTCSKRAKVGAILFDRQNRIIATGYNGAPTGMPHCDNVGCNLDKDGHCLNSIHAEMNALLQCGIVGRSTIGLRLFTTHSPCWRCTMTLLQAGIVEITYMQRYGSKENFDAINQLLFKRRIALNAYIGLIGVK